MTKDYLVQATAEENLAPNGQLHSVQSTDKLDMDAINALPGPLMVRFCGDDLLWPVHDIEVATGLMRIDVCGLLQVKEFCEVMELYDGDGDKHDPNDFWSDAE